MTLLNIEVQHVRNIEKASLEFDSRLNMIVGSNASGKTSLLEAIFLLAQGKSFRTPRLDQLVQHQQTQMMVVGQVGRDGKKSIIGVARESRKTRVKIDGRTVGRSTEMIGRLPVQVMTPESHELLDKGPKMRRHYLDWGVFHVKHSYLDNWQRYHRILRQRNSSLRQMASTREIQSWDKQLADEAEQLHQARHDYISGLMPGLKQIGPELLDCEPEFEYRPGWDEAEGPYLAQLTRNIEKDRERGHTRLGPHRADLQIKIDGKPVLSVFSRGQQKLLVCAMTLAQVKQQKEAGIILVDDLAAELDPERRARLMQVLQDTGAQIFITATEPGLIPCENWPSSKMFHVKHGQFQEVI